MEKRINSKKALWHTNAYVLTLGAGNFETLDDGIKISENMIRNIRHWIEKNEYSVELASLICKDKAEFKGNEEYDVEYYDYESHDLLEVDPHLHIVVMAYPGETVAYKIKKYLEKVLKKKNCVNIQKIYDPERLILYLGHFAYIRTVTIDPNKRDEFKASRIKKKGNKYYDIVNDIKDLFYDAPIEADEINKSEIFADFWNYFSTNKLSTPDNIDISWYDNC